MNFDFIYLFGLVYYRPQWSEQFVPKKIDVCWQVARDVDLQEQIGKDIYFDLVDHDKVRSFRIQKQVPFNLFKVHGLLEIDIVRNLNVAS